MSSVNGVPTPENAKLTSLRPYINSIKMFLNFLENDRNIHLCERDTFLMREPEYHRTMRDVDNLIFEHMGIDKQKVEDERQAVLDKMAEAGDRYAIETQAKVKQWHINNPESS